MESQTILVSLLLLVLGYILGVSRDSSKTIFNKKLEIYSDIISHLSSTKYLKLNFDISVEKLATLAVELNVGQERYDSKSKHDLPMDQTPDAVNRKVHVMSYNDELIKLFAPARLFGSAAVINGLREYYSLIAEYHSIHEKRDIDRISKKISGSIMEVEQLMRKDLGYFRVLSKSDILEHLGTASFSHREAAWYTRLWTFIWRF